MGVLETLSLAMGTAWTSGLNLYATIAVLGLAGRAQMIQLPENLAILTDPLVIGAACIMYVIEFVADKVPYVDSGWDVAHTFIRVPAGALLAAQTVGDASPALELAALMAGGTVSLAAHGTKATARLAINASPEPFTNWFASVGEDVAVVGGLWLTFNHPVIMLAWVIGFMALAVWLIPKFYRLTKRGFQALWARLRGQPVNAAANPPIIK
jgi:hypothetical protein